MKRIIAACEHPAHKLVYNGLGLEVEIAQHCVTLLPANQLDSVMVHIRIEEGHGAPRAEGACADVEGEIAMGGPQGDGSFVQHGCYILGGHVFVSVVHEEGGKDVSRLCLMGAQVENASRHG